MINIDHACTSTASRRFPDQDPMTDIDLLRRHIKINFITSRVSAIHIIPVVGVTRQQPQYKAIKQNYYLVGYVLQYYVLGLN